MKRIKLFTSLAGPNGCYAAGEYEVPGEMPKKQADDVVKGGHGEYLKAEPEPEKKPEPERELETADDKQESREEATTRGGKGGGKKQRGRRRGGR